MSKYDKMLETNKKISAKKIELAQLTIHNMLLDEEKITVPKLMAKTGLSKGFFYKNATVRKLYDDAVAKQAGLVDPRRNILDMAMDHEIEILHQRIRELEKENASIAAELEKYKKALNRKYLNTIRNL